MVVAALAIAFCLGGCGPTPHERAEAEEEARFNAQRDADIQNLVNEARPLMNFVHEMEAEGNRMEKDQGGVEVANQAAGK
jgi:hypothetical protein